MDGSRFRAILSLAALLPALSTAQTPIICEDNIDGQPPFNSNDVPCLLGCGTPLAMATGGLLPGNVNETDIPYCQLNCVRSDASPAQSSAAPSCHQQCEERNAATPEQIGWCMFWCVEGGDIEKMVVSTTCVPSIQYVPEMTSTLYGTEVVTIERFSNPAAWVSWYATQTAISRTSLFIFGTPSPTSGLSTPPTTSFGSRSSSASSTSANVLPSGSALTKSATVLGEGAASTSSRSTATATTTSGQSCFTPAWPALAVALLFAVACF